MSVGFPGTLYLHDFGEHVRRAFGHVPYHVGSSLTLKDGWRDVDVRLMLPDDEYEALKLGNPERPNDNPKWVSICLAWSAFGKAMTGLPIDFQIQQQAYANAKYPMKAGNGRGALFNVAEMFEHEETRRWAIEQYKAEVVGEST